MTKEKRKVKINIGDGNPMVSAKSARNAKCQCGSGKKQKHCCGDSTKYFNTKPTKTNNHDQI